MRIELINEENKDNLDGIVPDFITENLYREHFRGMAVYSELEERPAAVMFWELFRMNILDREPEACIVWFSFEDKEYGRELLREYGKRAAAKGVKRTVILVTYDMDSPEAELLREEGFELTIRESPDVVVTIKEMSEHPMASKKKIGKAAKAISSLSTNSFRRGLLKCMKGTDREHDVISLPMSWFDPDISSYVAKDGEPVGFSLLHCTSSGTLRMELLIVLGERSNEYLISMISFCLIEAKKKYPPETLVILPKRDEASAKLIKYFFPNKEIRDVLYGIKR